MNGYNIGLIILGIVIAIIWFSLPPILWALVTLAIILIALYQYKMQKYGVFWNSLAITCIVIVVVSALIVIFKKKKEGFVNGGYGKYAQDIADCVNEHCVQYDPSRPCTNADKYRRKNDWELLQEGMRYEWNTCSWNCDKEACECRKKNKQYCS